jgi:hypothetical protein
MITKWKMEVYCILLITDVFKITGLNIVQWTYFWRAQKDENLFAALSYLLKEIKIILAF